MGGTREKKLEGGGGKTIVCRRVQRLRPAKALTIAILRFSSFRHLRCKLELLLLNRLRVWIELILKCLDRNNITRTVQYSPFSCV